MMPSRSDSILRVLRASSQRMTRTEICHAIIAAGDREIFPMSIGDAVYNILRDLEAMGRVDRERGALDAPHEWGPR